MARRHARSTGLTLVNLLHYVSCLPTWLGSHFIELSVHWDLLKLLIRSQHSTFKPWTCKRKLFPTISGNGYFL